MLRISQGRCDGMSSPMLGFLMLLRARPQTIRYQKNSWCVWDCRFGKQQRRIIWKDADGESRAKGKEIFGLAENQRSWFWLGCVQTVWDTPWWSRDGVCLLQPYSFLVVLCHIWFIEPLSGQMWGYNQTSGMLMQSLLELFLMNAQPCSLTFLAVDVG